MSESVLEFTTPSAAFGWAEALGLLGAAWALAAVVMLLLWLRQRRTQDATPVDVGWAALLGLIATLYALLSSGLPARRALVVLMVLSATWRLALHLWLDRARKGVEDGRYAELRAKWGARADLKFFGFFQAQALLDVLLSVPFLLACARREPLDGFDLAALLLWIAGFVGEALADLQLAAFKVDPANRGRTCRRGLWAFSRHPNYFFQWLLWVSYALAALPGPAGWAGLASPLAMLGLMLFVTGIPPTEAQALRTRGEDYREYQRSTSAFFPWFRRPGSARRTN